jgi:LysR family transcriptional regulator, low CO2-responsive transcriptional regulator
MAMEIRQLRTLIAIAETGTFTAAAQRLHVTQAAISMQIRQLEDELGVQLFVRAPRRVRVTEAGEALCARARAILTEHDAAIAELSSLAASPHYRLRIGTASTRVSAAPLPSILQALKARHPLAEVTVVSGTSEKLIRQILAGNLDVAFVSLPVEAADIETEALEKDALVVIASPDHPLARRRVVTAAMLAAEKLILSESGGNTRRLIDAFFSQARAKPQIAMELGRQAAINRMVEQRLGVSIAPIGAVRDEIRSGRLVSRPIEGASLSWQLGLAYLRSAQESPIVRAFKALCREAFSRASLPRKAERKRRRRGGS